MPYADASTYHILWSDVVLIEAGAIGQTLEPIAGDGGAPAKRDAPAADAAEGERKAAKRAAKTAAKKAAPKKAAAKAAAKKAEPAEEDRGEEVGREEVAPKKKEK